MEVILLKDVPNKGQVGAIVNVAPGYARNCLIPNGMALLATSKNKRQRQHLERLAQHRRVKAKAEAEATAKKLVAMTLQIARKVGQQDKLYGSVTAIDIHEALFEQGIEIDRRRIELAEPIRQLGETDVGIRLEVDVRCTLKVVVTAEA